MFGYIEIFGTKHTLKYIIIIPFNENLFQVVFGLLY